MIYDVNRSGPPALEGRHDVCIAGAGVAGITLARDLARRGKRVLLLEAGGREASDLSQDVYRGDNVGRSYFDLDVTRLRYFGGTSNHWGGMCRPLDASDFAPHDHIDGSGWPIDLTDLDPYLTEALRILELSPIPTSITLADSDGRLKEVFFGFLLSPPVRFAEKFGDELESSEAVNILLNANLIDIELDAASGGVTSFLYRGYKDDAPAEKVTAKRYVLALGGIENPRALLLANNQMSNGIGNQNDLVGRFFMEHLVHDVGFYILTVQAAGYGKRRRFLAPSGKLMKEAKIANAGFRLLPVVEPEKFGTVARALIGMKHLMCEYDAVGNLVRTLGSLDCFYRAGTGRFRVACEQVPNANSRVSLGAANDRFGRRRVELDWRLTAQDKLTIRLGALEIARYFALRDIGRIKLFDWVLDDGDTSIPGLAEGEETASNHHMGTTRMGATERDGVVNQDCQVFGTNNLYIAGSSVFRTSGHANPTLSIVQMTLRLADHLAAL